MSAGALFMIHNAWTVAGGDKNAFLDMAGLLEKIDGTLADAYSAHTGKPASELKGLMDEETWFTAEEAVEFGFAASIEEKAEGAKAAALDRLWNLRAFEKAPAEASAPQEQPTCEDFERRVRVASLCRAA